MSGHTPKPISRERGEGDRFSIMKGQCAWNRLVWNFGLGVGLNNIKWILTEMILSR